MNQPVALFRDQFGIDERAIDRTLGTALERSVDHADLFFEYTSQDSVVLEEGIVKSGDRHLIQGAGVRVQTGERQGYAHSDEITAESLELAAGTARAISERGNEGGAVAIAGSGAPPNDSVPGIHQSDGRTGRPESCAARRDRRLRAGSGPPHPTGDG